MTTIELTTEALLEMEMLEQIEITPPFRDARGNESQVVIDDKVFKTKITVTRVPFGWMFDDTFIPMDVAERTPLAHSPIPRIYSED